FTFFGLLFTAKCEVCIAVGPVFLQFGFLLGCFRLKSTLFRIESRLVCLLPLLGFCKLGGESASGSLFRFEPLLFGKFSLFFGQVEVFYCLSSLQICFVPLFVRLGPLK